MVMNLISTPAFLFLCIEVNWTKKTKEKHNMSCYREAEKLSVLIKCYSIISAYKHTKWKKQHRQTNHNRKLEIAQPCYGVKWFYITVSTGCWGLLGKVWLKGWGVCLTRHLFCFVLGFIFGSFPLGANPYTVCVNRQNLVYRWKDQS